MVAKLARWTIPSLDFQGPARRTVGSRSTPGEVQHVDLEELTCTCSNHARLVEEHGPRTAKSLCGHLRRELRASLPRGELGDLWGAIVERRGQKDAYFAGELPSGVPIVIGTSEERPWIDVYVPQGKGDDRAAGPWQCFGFHPRKGRWSYDNPPERLADEVSEFLRNIPDYG
jgi:hypothetical protein